MEDKIAIIETTTAERKQETLDLFKEVEPLLKEGMPFTVAVAKVKGLNHKGFQARAWYKELREYAINHGYDMRR